MDFQVAGATESWNVATQRLRFKRLMSRTLDKTLVFHLQVSGRVPGGQRSSEIWIERSIDKDKRSKNLNKKIIGINAATQLA